MALAEPGVALSREGGDRRSLIIGLAMLQQLERNSARRLLLNAEQERVARELGSTWWVADALWGKGMFLEGQDEAGARAAYEQAAALYRITGDAWGRVWMLTAVARYAQR